MSKIKKGVLFILVFIGVFFIGCSSIGNNEKDTSTEKNVSKEEVKEEPLTSIEAAKFTESTLSYNVIKEFENTKDLVFQNKYSDIEGIFTFRGNSLRNSPSYGTVDVKDKELEVLWQFNTSSSTWGGGAGWTGQPSIVKWPEELRKSMNIYDEFKDKRFY